MKKFSEESNRSSDCPLKKGNCENFGHSSGTKERKTNFEWCFSLSSACPSHNYTTKHKFAYVRRVILRTALGAAPRERPTANSIRIAAAVQKHSIRNKPALPACLPAWLADALVARRFPVREPMYNAYGIEDPIVRVSPSSTLFLRGEHLRLPSKNFHGYGGMPLAWTRFPPWNVDSPIHSSINFTLTKILHVYNIFFKAHHICSIKINSMK